MPTRTSDVLTATIWPNTALVILARVLGTAGTPINQASISSISFKSYLDGTEVYSTSPVVSTTIFNSLQTGDDRWDQDNTGYNLALTVSGSAFPLANKRYTWELILTPASGSRIVIVGQTQTRNMVG